MLVGRRGVGMTVLICESVSGLAEGRLSESVLEKGTGRASGASEPEVEENSSLRFGFDLLGISVIGIATDGAARGMSAGAVIFSAGDSMISSSCFCFCKGQLRLFSSDA